MHSHSGTQLHSSAPCSSSFAAMSTADAERLLTTIPQISFNYFTAKDVVRHPLVAAIIEAYEAEG